jgi:hypothetical protein
MLACDHEIGPEIGTGPWDRRHPASWSPACWRANVRSLTG